MCVVLCVCLVPKPFIFIKTDRVLQDSAYQPAECSDVHCTVLQKQTRLEIPVPFLLVSITQANK